MIERCEQSHLDQKSVRRLFSFYLLSEPNIVRYLEKGNEQILVS